MEHSTISGDYKDVGTGDDPILLTFPTSGSSLRPRYLGDCVINADTGVITQADVATSPRIIGVVPSSPIQGSRVLRDANFSLALVALQETGAVNSGIFVPADLQFIWALRYLPAGSAGCVPSVPSSYSSAANGRNLYADAQFTLSSGMIIANDKSIHVQFPNPVVLQSGDAIVLQIWYHQAFPRATGFNGLLNIGLNSVLNYNISYK